MHKLGEFIEQQMGNRGWDRAILRARSGLSKQHISDLLEKRRTRLGNMIQPSTVTALAEAFDVSESVILIKAVEAMGVPVDKLPLVIAEEPSDDELLEILRRRLKNGERDVGLTSEVADATNPEGMARRVRRSRGASGRAGKLPRDSRRGGTDEHSEHEHEAAPPI